MAFRMAFRTYSDQSCSLGKNFPLIITNTYCEDKEHVKETIVWEMVDFLIYLQQDRERSPKTIKSKAENLTDLLNFCERQSKLGLYEWGEIGFTWRELNDSAIKKFRAYCFEDGLEPGTVRKKINDMYEFLIWAEFQEKITHGMCGVPEMIDHTTKRLYPVSLEGKIYHDPKTGEIKWISYKGNVKVSVPTQDNFIGVIKEGDIDALFDNLENKREKASSGSKDSLINRDALVVQWLMDSGLRVSELVALDIDILPTRERAEEATENNEILMVELIKGTKNGKKRMVKVSPYLIEDTYHYIEFYRTNSEICTKNEPNALFLSVTTGNRINAQTITNLIRECTNSKYSPHAIRKYFANQLAIQIVADAKQTGKIDPNEKTQISALYRQLADLLGHKDVTTTIKHYIDDAWDRVNVYGEVGANSTEEAIFKMGEENSLKVKHREIIRENNELKLKNEELLSRLRDATQKNK